MPDEGKQGISSLGGKKKNEFFQINDLTSFKYRLK
jgi:hypothetical protein